MTTRQGSFAFCGGSQHHSSYSRCGGPMFR